MSGSLFISDAEPERSARRGPRRLRVEEVHALDLARLRRDGLFRQPGTLWVSRWHPSAISRARSEVAYVLGPPEHPIALAILERAAPDSRWGSAGAYAAALDWTPCHFGGRRPWLRCPADGCGRRVRILYRPLGERLFACRHCHKLSYRARQLHRLAMFEGFERPLEAVRRFERARGRRRASAARRLVALLPNVERLLAARGAR